MKNHKNDYLKKGKENKKAVNNALCESSIYMSTVSPTKSNTEVPPGDSANIYPPVKTTTSTGFPDNIRSYKRQNQANNPNRIACS